MAFDPIGAIQGGGGQSAQGVSGTGYIGGTANINGTASAGDSNGFATALTGAVDNLQSLQSASNQLAVSAVSGNLDDIHKATIAATRAQITMELVSTVRNKGVDAFNEIMRMQA
ncbi:flagellar hook-basal body complex protein FliE [Arthrobacter bambusae]|uniref:flagellar hook-basal body complex protein FliE n=1 Tax=Arthrobacter bambusae TaxID=1338426 RepID=UPI00277FFF62|nr:flagellar hook-basal body complex protein FliE [Arthrobacter bambusae]MDQ0029428.1 flagellar hook-basal body complex protein FliE [Arthrobacter bambusae]MDQ0097088.1 flagellar hook-basal body complex protein FliE [Arthrobacter bambusae]